MKKTAVLSLLFVSAGALLAQGPRGGGGFGPMGRGPGGPGGPGMGGPGGGMGMSAVVTGAPYSALQVVQTQETLADGNSISRKRQTTVYRDGQGRVRTEETVTPEASTGAQPFTRVTILDYVGGFRYELDAATMVAHQSPLHIPRTPPADASGNTAGSGNSAMVRRSTPAAEVNRPQVVKTTLAPQVVNGTLAVGTQHMETIPVGAIGNARPIQVSRVTYVSNELKVPVQIRSSDPRFGTTDMELTNIVQAEPSAALFVVPAGYTVKTGGRGPGGPGGPGGQRGARPVQQ